MGIVQIIGAIIVGVIALFMLFVDVLAAEGYFGDPANWSHWDSHNVRRICGIICVAVLFLTGHELPKKKKWGEIEDEVSESENV